jgi:apolipoprotein N-acyltransferase
MKRHQSVILCLTSSVLLSFGWYEWGSGLILLVGLIPLLMVEDAISSYGQKHITGAAYIYASLTFLIWNLLTTWWVKNASFVGLLAAVLVSSFFMGLAFMLYSATKYRMGRTPGYASLIIYWLAFEFAYNHGEISWPWLTLGNGFMYDIKIIQWYEYTGVFGGSLWVLMVNILLYEFIRRRRTGIPLKNLKPALGILSLLILVPVIFSMIRYFTYEEQKNPREIVVVQPNIDPYMKFNDIPQIEQTMIQIEEAARLTTDSTDYVVTPETSISGQFWINELETYEDFIMVRSFRAKYPKLKYIVGIYCFERYTSPELITKTARQMGRKGFYFDTHNSAIQIDSSEFIPIYHKSMLVTGVEKMPYTWLFKPIEKLTLQLGGIFRSHGIQKEREVFTAPNDSINIAPVICYESVYGEYVGDYIKKGANSIFVITNDGWWGNTPGHRQHNALSSLRAIETRRSVARSANTGISSFINQRGDVLQELTWWKRGAIRDKVNMNTGLTFYVRYGDYIGRIAFYSALILIVILIGLKISRWLKTQES